MLDKIKAYGAIVAAITFAGLLLVQTGRLHTAQLATTAAENAVTKEQRDRETERVQLAQAYSKAVEDALAAQKIVNANYQEALNDARTRESAARRDAERARFESDGLREQNADAARRIADAATPEAAVRQYAATANLVFDQCQRSYLEMARVAQGHADDVRTLIGAWPRGQADAVMP